MKSLSVKLGVILIGFIIFSYAEVRGADWKVFDRDENFSYHYDTEIVKYPSKGIVNLQMKMVSIDDKGRDLLIKQRKQQKLSIKGYKNFTHAIILCEINCEKKLIGVISLDEYDKNGKILFSKIFPADQVVWVSITEGGMFELVNNVICSK